MSTAAALEPPAKRARAAGGPIALCGPAGTPVPIPRVAALRMRVVADILEDMGEGEGGDAARLEIPLPHIEAATMRAVVDFLVFGPSGEACAPLLRDTSGAAAINVVPLLVAANFLQAADLEETVVACLAYEAWSVGATLTAAPQDPTLALFAGLGPAGAMGDGERDPPPAHFTKLARLLDLRAALAAINSVEPELVAVVQRGVLEQRAPTAAGVGRASRPGATVLPPVPPPARNPSALKAYAAQSGSAVDKAIAVQLAGGTAVVRTTMKNEVLTVDGIAAAQVTEAMQLLKLQFKAPEVGEIEIESATEGTSALGHQPRVISGAVDSVAAYDCCISEGHDSYPDGYPDDYDHPEYTCDPGDLSEPRSHDVAVAVAGTLSVRATTAGSPGPSTASVPFTASLKFHEKCSWRDYNNRNNFRQDARGLTSLEFTVVIPDDSVLTEEEAELLTRYDFAPIDKDDGVQVGTKSIILLELADQLIQLARKPKYGGVTWQEEDRHRAAYLSPQHSFN